MRKSVFAILLVLSAIIMAVFLPLIMDTIVTIDNSTKQIDTFITTDTDLIPDTILKPEQIVRYGDFSTGASALWTDINGTITYGGDTVLMTALDSGVIGIYYSFLVNVGEEYYVSVRVKASTNGDIAIGFDPAENYNLPLNEWVVITKKYTAPSGSLKIQQSVGALGDTLEVDYISVLPLNNKEYVNHTVEWFDLYYPDYVEYSAVRSYTPTERIVTLNYIKLNGVFMTYNVDYTTSGTDLLILAGVEGDEIVVSYDFGSKSGASAVRMLYLLPFLLVVATVLYFTKFKK